MTEQQGRQAGRVTLWVGDSFTAGEGSGLPAARTYPHVVSERLGWQCRVDAQNGTGFVNDGWAASPDHAPLIGRLRDQVHRGDASIVVLDAGRNDVEATVGELEAAVAECLAALREVHPSARIVIVLPSLVGEVQPPEYLRVGAVLRAFAPTCGAVVVDPAAAGAFADPIRNADLVSADGFHPGRRGQAHYADCLEYLLRQALA